MSALNESNRARIIELISLMPGLHLRQLQRLLGISFSSTRYHVKRLESSGKLLPKQDRGFVRLYPKGINESDLEIYPFLRNRTARLILSALIEQPGLSNKEISERTGLAKSTISEYLTRFLSAKIVKSTMAENKRIAYEIQDPSHLLYLLMTSKGRVNSTATDRFVDLWDF